MASLRIAVAQVNAHVGNLEANAILVRRTVQQAVERGAHVVVLPEMVLPGYPVEDLALRGSFHRAVAARLTTLATELADDGLGGIAVVLGTLGTTDEGRPTNSAVVLQDGRLSLHYRKHHLPTYGVFDEHRIFTPGTEPAVLEVAGRRLGLAICEDIWHESGPVAQYRDLDALLVLNGSPFEHGKREVRHRHAAAQARRLGTAVVYVNLVGGQDDLVFDGASFVLDRSGQIVAAAPALTEHLLLVDLAADGAPSAVDDDDAVRARDSEAVDETGEMYNALVLGLRDYARKNGFRRVVLGLSGGIDSGLVAAIAADADAVDGPNVVAVSMPSAYSSDHSRDDAEAQAISLGLDYRSQPIGPMFDAFQGEMALEGVPEENLQARLRGVVLMAISNSEGPLVLATGNKSDQGRVQDPGVGAVALAQQAGRGRRRARGDPVGGHREGALGRAAPRPARRRLPARVRRAGPGPGGPHRALPRARGAPRRGTRRGRRRSRPATGGRRGVEAPPVPDGPEGDHAGLRPRPHAAGHLRLARGLTRRCTPPIHVGSVSSTPSTGEPR